MALSPKHISLLALLFTICSLHVQARESVFFNKEVHYNSVKETQPVPEPAPSPNQEEPINYTQENQNGYGLYGHGLDHASPTNTFNNVEYTDTARNVPSKFSTEEYTTMTNEKNYMNNKEFTTTYPNNELDNKQYGMSDTRFMENGKYFHDVNAENNYGYRYESGRKSNQRYGVYGNMERMNKYNNGGYYGNNEKTYEYKGSQEIEEEDEDMP